jgi:hypothetical protein
VFCAFGLTTTERFLLVAQHRGQENARIWVASAGIFSGSGEEVFGLMVFFPFSTPTAELVYDLRVCLDNFAVTARLRERETGMGIDWEGIGGTLV